MKTKLFALLFFVPTIVTAQVDESSLSVVSNTASSTASSSFGFWGVIQIVIIFGLIILSIYGLFFLLKKSTTQSPLEEDGLINVIDNKSLGASRFLHLVRVSDEYFLISSTDTNVNLVTKIDNPETVGKLKLEISEIKSKDKTFAEVLGGQGIKSSIEFLKGQKDKLKSKQE